VEFYEPREYRFVSPALADDSYIRQAVDLLHQAQRPLIIAGSAASYSGSGNTLQRFIETTRVPLMTEGDARGLVPDDHPYCLGFFDSGLNWAARLLKKADVVMLLGRKQDGILGYAMPPTISQDARLIQIDPSAAEIGRNRGVAVGIVGEMEAIVEQLTGEASGRKWSDLEWLGQLRAERDAQGESLDQLAVPETPMHAMQVHKTLKPFLREDDYLVFDGGDFCHFGRACIPALGPKQWLYLPPLGMLGSALPTALAAKLAHPRRRVVMLTGDGSFGFNAMEYDTAVRHNLPIVGIMGNDAAWGIDRQIQLGVFGKAVATDLLPTRYDLVVRGLGGHGERVATPEELPSAIRRAFDSDLPSLLNVDVQRAISPRAEAAIERWKSESLQPF